MMYPISRTFLALSGATAVLIGSSVLFSPHAFFATNQITLGTDPNLMSEIRAPGGLLLAAGIVMICGAAARRLMLTAMLTSAVVYCAYGVSRLMSVVLDGAPSMSLLGALAIELILGAIAIVLIAKSGVSRSNI